METESHLVKPVTTGLSEKTNSDQDQTLSEKKKFSPPKVALKSPPPAPAPATSTLVAIPTITLPPLEKHIRKDSISAQWHPKLQEGAQSLCQVLR